MRQINKLISAATFVGILISATAVAQTVTAPVAGTNNFVAKFTGATTIANSQIYDNGTNVGLGTTSPASLFSVNGNGFSTVTGYFRSTLGTGSAALRGDAATPSGANNCYGVQGVATSGTGYMYGTYGSSTNTTAQNSGRAYGIYGLAGNATSGWNYGVYGRLSGTNNGAAVFGTLSGDVSIPGTYAGYFDGLIRTTVDTPEKPTAGSWTGYSDRRLKKEIAPFKDGLNVLMKIDPVTYKFNGIGGLSAEETHVGVIAQDVQKVAPYCIGTGRLAVDPGQSGEFGGGEAIGYGNEAKVVVKPLTYNYDALIYVMINSIKELSTKNEQMAKEQAEQAAKMEALQDKLSKLESIVNASAAAQGGQPQQGGNSIMPSASSITEVELSSKNVVVLDQNAPNPFAQQTTISYFLPDNTGKAEMLFYNSGGMLIKTIQLEKGKGQVNVFASDLTGGVYTYSIVIDGKVSETKRMIKQ